MGKGEAELQIDFLFMFIFFSRQGCQDIAKPKKPLSHVDTSELERRREDPERIWTTFFILLNDRLRGKKELSSSAPGDVLYRAQGTCCNVGVR